MAKSKTNPLARRGFLKGAAAGAAASAAALVAPPIVAPPAAQAQEATGRGAALPPSAAQRAAENVTPAAAAEDIQIVERPGADYMVDVFKSLGFEYLFATPGSSFRGIHESVINHGGNQQSGVHHLYARRVLGGGSQWLRQN